MRYQITAVLLVCTIHLMDAQVDIGSDMVDTSSVVTGLDTPWEVLWGPDGRIWFTERYGRVSALDVETGTLDELLTIDEVWEESESGLLGMAVDPDFEENSYVYLVYNYYEGGSIREKLVRFSYQDGQLADPLVLLADIGGARNHNGSRLAFGLDKKLYMTTGDAINTSTSQDLGSLNGKILRVHPDGSVPDDNPIEGSYVWSYGHRNPQGLVFAPSGLLYSSEHGPSTDDELNLITVLGNYGWPGVHGFCDEPSELAFCEASEVMEPLAAWTPTLAVAGIDYYDHEAIPGWYGSVLMTSLKASRLTVLNLSKDGLQVTKETTLFDGWWGRLRDVCVAPDGRVFLATSNRDGRGSVQGGDDRIIEISPAEETGFSSPRSDQSGMPVAYPNPATGEVLRLVNLHPGETLFLVSDLSGKPIWRKRVRIKGPELAIPFDWQPGVYLVTVVRDGYSFNQRVVKQ